MTEKKQIMLRLKEDVIEQLKKEADEQCRSVNNLLEFIIKEYFDNK